MSNEDPKPWKVLSSKNVYTHPYHKVDELEVELPDGKVISYLSFPGPDVTVVVLVNKNNQILIARQYNVGSGTVVHEFPGGMIEEGETPAFSGAREAAEEVGLFPRKTEIVGSYYCKHRRSSKKCYVVFGTDLEEKEPAPETGEFIAKEWMSIEEIDSKIASGEFQNITLLSAWAILKAKGLV